MSKQRLIYILALVVALAVLVWDKTSPRKSDLGPKGAQGAHAQPNSSQIAVPKPDDLYPEGSTAIEHTPAPAPPDFLVRLIDQVVPGEPQRVNGEPHKTTQQATMPTRDLFQATGCFLDTLQAAEHRENQHKNHWLQQAGNLHLSGIIIGTQGSCALINDQVISPGAKIGPYRLTRIDNDAVLLRIQQDTIRLSLDDPPVWVR